jgi:hypothetical protein
MAYADTDEKDEVKPSQPIMSFPSNQEKTREESTPTL